MIFELVDIYLMKFRRINIHDAILTEIQGAKLDELITFEVEYMRTKRAKFFFKKINRL